MARKTKEPTPMYAVWNATMGIWTDNASGIEEFAEIRKAAFESVNNVDVFEVVKLVPERKAARK